MTFFTKNNRVIFQRFSFVKKGYIKPVFFCIDERKHKQMNDMVENTQKQPVIYSALNTFPFTDIFWNRPTHVLGEPNNFIISTLMKQRGVSIYVETPECSLLHTKKTGDGERLNPLVKIGKKYFFDFLFTDVEWLSWLEHLEDLSHQRLLSNQTEWFQTEMTEDDMENLFVSPFKMVKGKGGKQFSVRTAFPLDKTLKIFDEKKQQVNYELDNLGSIITEETRFKAIVEVVGIKCSPRNFHLEMEVKQMMILKDNPVFVECLISVPNSANLEKTIVKEETVDKGVSPPFQQQVVFKEPIPEPKQDVIQEPIQEPKQNVIQEPISEEEEIANLFYKEIQDFDNEVEKKGKTHRELAIEKMINIRVLGMTEFLKKRGIQGENILLNILSSV